MDDTFLLFKEKQHANLFLEYLNKEHNNIEYTLEYKGITLCCFVI